MKLPFRFSFKHISLPFSILLLSLITPYPALASQLIIKNNCNFVVDVPGIFGPTHLKYSAAEGTVYEQGRDDEFCGSTTMETPMGSSTSATCFVVKNGQFISGDWGNKVSSSTCMLDNGASAQLAFDSAETVAYIGSGLASLRGQAFLKTVGGDVKTCAGEDVILIPATQYFDGMIENTKRGIDTNIDQRAMSLLRRTICDAQGNFTLSKLPTQKWYVLTQVKWGIPHIEQPGERPGPITALLFGIPSPPTTDEQGGELLQMAILQPGDNQIFLTDRDKK